MITLSTDTNKFTNTIPHVLSAELTAERIRTTIYCVEKSHARLVIVQGNDATAYRPPETTFFAGKEGDIIQKVIDDYLKVAGYSKSSLNLYTVDGKLHYGSISLLIDVEEKAVCYDLSLQMIPKDYVPVPLTKHNIAYTCFAEEGGCAPFSCWFTTYFNIEVGYFIQQFIPITKEVTKYGMMFTEDLVAELMHIPLQRTNTLAPALTANAFTVTRPASYTGCSMIRTKRFFKKQQRKFRRLVVKHIVSELGNDDAVDEYVEPVDIPDDADEVDLTVLNEAYITHISFGNRVIPAKDLCFIEDIQLTQAVTVTNLDFFDKKQIFLRYAFVDNTGISFYLDGGINTTKWDAELISDKTGIPVDLICVVQAITDQLI